MVDRQEELIQEQSHRRCELEGQRQENLAKINARRAELGTQQSLLGRLEAETRVRDPCLGSPCTTKHAFHP